MTEQIISSGQTSSGLVIRYNNGLEVMSGGEVISTLVDGAVQADEGSTVSGAIVHGGGDLEADGLVSGVTLRAITTGKIKAAYLELNGVGVAYNTSVTSYCVEDVGGGAIQYDGKVFSGGLVRVGEQFTGAEGYIGGTTSDFTTFGGTVTVENGGVVVGTRVDSGFVVASAGGSAAGSLVNGGGIFVSSGGYISGSFVRSGGGVSVDSGGVASATRISAGGGESVFDGGESIGAYVLSGGDELVDGYSTVSSLTLSSGAVLSWFKGGAVDGLTLHAGALIRVNATSAHGVISGGSLEIFSAGGKEIESSTVSGGGAGLALEVVSNGAGVTELMVVKSSADTPAGAEATGSTGRLVELMAGPMFDRAASEALRDPSFKGSSPIVLAAAVLKA